MMFDPGPAIRLQSAITFLLSIFTYFYPDYILSFILRSERDGVHWHIARCACALAMMQSVLHWCWSRSTDPSPNSASLISNIQVSFFGLVATVYAKVMSPDYFYTKALTTVMIVFLVILLFNTFLLIKSGWPIGRLQFEPDRQKLLNRLLSGDSYAAFLIGIIWIGFPDLLLKRQITFALTPHHAYICRVFGGALTSSSAYGGASAYFQNSSDRLYGFIARALASFLILASQIHSQYAYHQWWTNAHWVGLSLFSVWATLVVYFLIQVMKGKMK